MDLLNGFFYLSVIAITTADKIHHKLFLKAVVVFKFNFFFRTS